MSTAFIQGIGQISVNTHDLERATRFYRDVLRLKLLFEVPARMAFFDCGGTRLMLAKPEAPEFDHPSSILYFRVLDIETAFEALRTAGAEVLREPQMTARMSDHDLWMGFFKDTEGNVLALMAELKR